MPLRSHSYANQRTVSARAARGVACTSSVHATKPVQVLTSTPAERFSAAIIQYPAKQIARIAERSIDTVNSWRGARRLPNHESLQKLEPHYESVRRFLANEFPNSFGANHPEGPEAIDAAVRRVMKEMGREQ